MIWQGPVISLGSSLILVFIDFYFEVVSYLRKEASNLLPGEFGEAKAISIPGSTLSTSRVGRLSFGNPDFYIIPVFI